MKTLKFSTKTAAKRETGISYLGGVNTSAKTQHGEKFNIDTFILYLAPANMSGHNVCPFSSPECRAACLCNSGRVKVEQLSGRSTINDCRIKRTKLFYENREFFFSWLVAEIETAKKRAEKAGHIFAVRLNGTSDLLWENYRFMGSTIFEIFPDVTFYDYTKVPGRKLAFIPNYSLTFSYTGRNLEQATHYLSIGINVAVVFDTKRGEQLPDLWREYTVLDGDVTDYRPADLKGNIVGLRFKTLAKKSDNENAINSIFVVNANSAQCDYIRESNKVALPF